MEIKNKDNKEVENSIDLKEILLSFFSTTIKGQYSSLIQKTQNIQKFYYYLLKPEIEIKDKVTIYYKIT